MRRIRVPAVLMLASLAAVAATSSAVAATTLVTACGQSVRGVALLARDLDCTGVDGPAVTLKYPSSRLRLRGYTLTGDALAVRCEGSCKIDGPGTIRRAAFGYSSTDGAFVGVGRADDRFIQLELAVVRGVTFENWGYALLAQSANVRYSRFYNNDFGVTAFSSRILRSTFTGHTTMAVAPIWHGQGDVIVGGRCVISACTFAANYIDIATAKVRPVVRHTTCTTSYDQARLPWAGGDVWNVCP